MKKVVITGISRGIGLETARYFLEKNWLVIGTSTSGKTPLNHKHLKCYPLDLSNSESILVFSQQITEFDLLINNAAILVEDWGSHRVNMELLRKTFAVNVFGTIELTEFCLPRLNPDGQIINITSGWGAFSSNDSAQAPHYKISKASLNMYTLTLAERLPLITVSSFDPGWVKTDMGSEMAPKYPRQTAEEIYNLVNTDKKSGCFWIGGEMRAW